jgi:hypothetical protein
LKPSMKKPLCHSNHPTNKVSSICLTYSKISLISLLPNLSNPSTRKCCNRTKTTQFPHQYTTASLKANSWLLTAKLRDWLTKTNI